MIRVSLIFFLYFLVFSFHLAEARASSFSRRNFRNVDIVNSLAKKIESKAHVEGFLSGDKSARSLGIMEQVILRTNHIFNDAFSIYIEGDIFFKQGTFQTVYLREKDSKSSGFDISSLYVSWNPKKQWKVIFPSDMAVMVRAGSLNQSILNAPLLVGDWSFLGFRQEVYWLPDVLSSYINRLHFVFQQTITPVQSELARFQQVQDLPMFFSASAFARNLYKDIFHFKGHITSFYFRNLLGEVAKTGLILGNSISKLAQVESEFPYPFFGFHASLESYFSLFFDLDVHLKTSFLWNLGYLFPHQKGVNKAPASLQKRFEESKGQSIFLGLLLHPHRDIDLVSSIEYFVNQSNSSPAYFNSERYRHNSKSGYILGLRSEFKKQNLYVDLKYAIIQSFTIDDPLGNPNYLEISVGTRYKGEKYEVF